MDTLAQIALFVVLLQVIFRPLVGALLFTRPPRMRVTFRAPEAWGAPFHDVTFTSGDDLVLSGWYIPSRNGAAIVLVHGHGGNRLAVSYHAETLVREGYGVLLFDLRAHGDSEGRRFVRGKEAVDDVLAAVSFAARQPDVQGRVGIMGVSIGGMLALQAAARNVYVRAVAADGPSPATLDDLPPPEGLIDRLWRYPMERYYQAVIDRLSQSQRPPANMAALRRIAGRPVLFIDTGRGLEQRLTQRFYDAAAEPKYLWEVPRAGHAAGWVQEPGAYGQALVDFFSRALSVGESRVSQPEQPAQPDGDATDPDMPATLAASAPAGPLPVGERTVSAATTMMIAFATIPVAMMGLLIPFQLRWGLAIPHLPEERPVSALLSFLGLLLAGLLLHEGLHWLAYLLLGRVQPHALKFGGSRAAIAPQVYCDALLPARTFRLILLLPGLLLGILPGIAAIVIGSWALVVWALWMVVAAAGDLVVLWAMRGVPATAAVRSHPTRAGCQLFSPQSLQKPDNRSD